MTEQDALAVLDAAVESGVTFLDTADVYGDGRSERIIGQFLAANPGPAGHGRHQDGPPGRAGPGAVHAGELPRLDRPVPGQPRRGPLDLVQLHCPPTPVYSTDAVYDALDTLVAEQRIAAYGVSVETCDEALTAIARPGVASVQIILNAFRRKPLDAGAARGAGGRGRRSSPGYRWPPGCCPAGTRRHRLRPADDHRTYNRHGEAFDVGETFSGVDYDTGVDAAAGVRRAWRQAPSPPTRAA